MAVCRLDGSFVLDDVDGGPQRLVFYRAGQSAVVAVRVEEGEDLDLGRLVLKGSPGSNVSTATLARLESLTGLALAPDSISALSEVAASLGVAPDDWEEFEQTGKLPSTEAGPVTAREILQWIYAVQRRLTPRDVELAMTALTGVDMDRMRDWLNAATGNWTGWPQSESLQPALASLFRRWLDEGGSLRTYREIGDGGIDALLNAWQSESNEFVLYDAAWGGPPSDQGWWFLCDPLDAATSESFGELSVAMDTLPATSWKAGYFTQEPLTGERFRHPNLPQLDSASGFVVGISLAVEKEKHLRPDRAGLSLLILCSDGQAIELGFWRDEIWAQGDQGRVLFQDSKQETAAVQAGEAGIRLEVRIQGGRYTVVRSDRELLSGPLRNYSAFGAFPYTARNMIFVGDNTSSAGARFRLERVAVRCSGGVRRVPQPEQRDDADHAPASITEPSARRTAPNVPAESEWPRP